MDDIILEIHLSDTFTPISLNHRIVSLNDEIRFGGPSCYVSALIERDGCVLVEKSDGGKYVLPRGIVAKGETPQDALFRIFGTKYDVDVIVGNTVDLKSVRVPIMNVSDLCYRVTVGDCSALKGLMWVSI